MMIDLIGYLAAGCTTISFLPQAYMVYKTDRTDGISLYMFLIL
jgi:MtN3 and saliva related transmembrane protein